MRGTTAAPSTAQLRARRERGSPEEANQSRAEKLFRDVLQGSQLVSPVTAAGPVTVNVDGQPEMADWLVGQQQ